MKNSIKNTLLHTIIISFLLLTASFHPGQGAVQEFSEEYMKIGANNIMTRIVHLADERRSEEKKRSK